MDGLYLNTALLQDLLIGFIREEVLKTGLTKVVIGLSGGVDSSLVAYLAVQALGNDGVHGFLLPYATSAKESEAHARLVVDTLRIQSTTINITPMVDSYFEHFKDASNIRRGNKMARERMSILYDQSAALGGLVLGTSNKTEMLLGYTTLFGDMAAALQPIGDIYKTQVWQLAKAMGVPQCIVEKAPSADLWAGQTDEQELGFTYRDVDLLLYYMIDERYSKEELIGKGFSEGFIDLILRKVRNSQFKRRLPVIAKVSNRTIDRDFRYPRDWGV